MRFGSLQLAGVGTMVLLSACQAPQVTFTPADEAAIESLASKYRQLLLAKDFDAWAELFTEDASYMAPESESLEGRAAIRASMDSAALAPTTELTVSLSAVVGSGNVAWARGTYGYTLPPAGDTASVTEVGDFLWGLEKQPSGSWLIAAEAYNTNAPAPPSG